MITKDRNFSMYNNMYIDLNKLKNLKNILPWAKNHPESFDKYVAYLQKLEKDKEIKKKSNQYIDKWKIEIPESIDKKQFFQKMSLSVPAPKDFSNFVKKVPKKINKINKSIDKSEKSSEKLLASPKFSKILFKNKNSKIDHDNLYKLFKKKIYNFFKKSFNFKDNLKLNFIDDKNWLFTFSESFFFYTFDLTSNILFSFLNNDSYLMMSKFRYNLLFNTSYNINIYFISYILDIFYLNVIFILPFFNKFFNFLYFSKEFEGFLDFHYELYFLYKQFLLFYVKSNFFYLSNYRITLNLFNFNESYVSSVILLMQFLFLLFFSKILIFIFFSYYTNLFNDKITYHSFLIFCVLSESEEEIGSLDDIILTFIIFIYLFFWFFWINSWTFFSLIPQLSNSFFFLPFLYFIIILIPFMLLYDYGIYFLVYLNGVSKSSYILIEFLFDCIAISIYFLRLLVQNVRLIFMLFTYFELHEFILFHFFLKDIIIFNDIPSGCWNKIKFYLKPSNWFLIFLLPIYLFKWLYNLFHTFFMVIFQFIAFFAMIFWLFLFLYTMFYNELQENFFLIKRNLRTIFFKKIFYLKNL